MTFQGWYQFKLFVEHASGISMDALHILVGFAVFILAAQLLKRTVASALPWLAVLVLELANEAYDLHVELWPDPWSQFGEGAKDIMLTMALPTLLLVLARWRPGLLGSNAGRADGQSTTT
jgi:diacylglycerol kinase